MIQFSDLIPSSNFPPVNRQKKTHDHEYLEKRSNILTLLYRDIGKTFRISTNNR
jgi:hypothetical protein